MSRISRIVIAVLVLALIAFLAWRFSSILTYILIAAVLSIMGNPLVKLLDKIKIKRWKFPHVLSSFLALITLIVVIGGLISIVAPLITNQAEMISRIDLEEVTGSLDKPLAEMQEFLMEYNLLQEKETLESAIIKNFESVVSFATFSDIFKDVLGLAGSLFIGVFAVLFITFFFLKEEDLFFNGIMLMIPLKYHEEGKKILKDSRRLLSRYFVGLLIELTAMVTLISTGLTIFGVKNAFLIGFLGGIMNVIPYLGPVIGTILGVILGTITFLSGGGAYADIFTLIVTIVTTFAISNLIDNMVLQPWIYSSSVKAHPLEIFLVIMIAGSMAGVLGMVLAIPSYTVLRIIAKQFLYNSRLVQHITKNI